ncbi:hypothetical protein RS130_18215 [Paraglaciecola aquimarina]|uniref:Uncharacterized protein n=1 Tax=Paraglaciecola aquimarina TaxID=1235557 RepID=A0ABU3SZY0_9ALTE|nr:hypothetical protein [Paraglaciecola aquimarina]MDU0355573.1 hypothetical protein [Paraglaciecola aquimarina]
MGSRQAIRDGEFKAIKQPMFTGKMELYDVRHDLSESYDLADQYPESIKEFEQNLKPRIFMILTGRLSKRCASN